MRQLEETIKLIPTIQNIVTGPLITNSIEIGHSPINFAYLGLEDLNNFVNQNVNRDALYENVDISFPFPLRKFSPHVQEAYEKLSKVIISIDTPSHTLYLKRDNFDNAIRDFIDTRNTLIDEAEKSSSCLNALSLVRLHYNKKEIPCHITRDIYGRSSILKVSIS